MADLTIGSLFSGIGGLEHGLELAGLGRVVFQVEKDPYCRAVLAKHWPHVERFEDVREFHPTGPVDVLCGGFPCQPWSLAGDRKETADERHLWPEYVRIIAEARPSIVIAENVPGLRARGLRLVLADLARLGFDAEWTMLSAADVGAPHLRRRLFIVATHPERVELRLQPGWCGGKGGAGAPLAAIDGEARVVAHAYGEGLEVGGEQPAREELPTAERGCGADRRWPSESGIRRTSHGVPNRLDRLRALGNAVVPQVAEVIGRAIVEALRV